MLLVASIAGILSAPGLGQTPRPGATASAYATSAPEDPVLTKIAQAVFGAWQSRRVDRSLYNAQASAQFTDALLREVSAGLSSGGRVKKFAYTGSKQVYGKTVYGYAITFEHPPYFPGVALTTEWIEAIATDPDGKISVLFFTPNTQPGS
ncbi:MAG: hypothetical protein DLM50_08495 [Candidatus Meridianibacter frigidus]|nr:MAG: hypothetical protein DLM50_08495 [Candidatus Eremiobacteraeota bacterium]